MNKMDSVKHPGTILGAIDLVGLVVTWTYFKKQIDKLNKQYHKFSKEENSLREDCKLQSENVQKVMEEFEKKLNNIIGAINTNRGMINHLNDRLTVLERNGVTLVSKGDNTAAIPVVTTHIVPVLPPIIKEGGTSNLLKVQSIKQDLPIIKRPLAQVQEEPSEDEENEEDDEVDLVVALAKRNSKTK